MSVEKTLEERGARYGQFIDHATIAQGLQEVLQEAPNWFRLQPDVRQMMVVITDKMARILNGDPDYTDNYHDIQGYAKLVEDRLLRDEEAKKGQLFPAESRFPDTSVSKAAALKDLVGPNAQKFYTPSQVDITDEVRRNDNQGQYNANPG